MVALGEGGVSDHAGDASVSIVSISSSICWSACGARRLADFFCWFCCFFELGRAALAVARSGSDRSNATAGM